MSKTEVLDVHVELLLLVGYLGKGVKKGFLDKMTFTQGFTDVQERASPRG